MKVEVVDNATDQTVETYVVRDLSLFDFQQWKDEQQQTIALEDLLERVSRLDSRDSETMEPNLAAREVDIYLPDPLLRQVIVQFGERRPIVEEESEFSDDLSELNVGQFSLSILKSSTVLESVVTEILLNHHPHSRYLAIISHG